MKTLIIALLVLGLAVVTGLILHTDPGQVVLGYETYTVETSLAFLLVTLAVVFTVFYLALRFLGGMFDLPKRFGRRSLTKKAERSQRGLTRGLLALSEGRYEDAERELTRHATQRGTALLGFLGAAHAANARGAARERDHYLKNALAQGPEGDLAVGLTQARMQLRGGQLDDAATNLERLSRGYPRNAEVLSLRAQLLSQREEWSELAALTPSLRKRKALPADGVDALETTAWVGQIERCDEAGLEECWDKLPKRAKGQSEVIAHYIKRRLAAGEADLAERQLRLMLDRNWDDQLASLYGDIKAEDVARQIDQAERWLSAHPKSTELLTTLGRLCVRRRLWGKARSAFESSLGLEADATTYYHYAALLEQLDEKDAAREAYHKGLSMSLGRGSNLPVPTGAKVEQTDSAAAEGDAEGGSHLRVVDGKG